MAGAGPEGVRAEKVVTYLEMASPRELRPGRPVPGMALEPVAADSPLIRDLHPRIGAAHDWPSTGWSDEEWARWLAHPGRRYWLVVLADEVAGAADAEPQYGGYVEITTFGLLPEFVGRGLGGHALTLAVREAWGLAEDVRRVWLRTSSRDHPAALPNYLRRGFRVFDPLRPGGR